MKSRVYLEGMLQDSKNVWRGQLLQLHQDTFNEMSCQTFLQKTNRKFRWLEICRNAYMKNSIHSHYTKLIFVVNCLRTWSAFFIWYHWRVSWQLKWQLRTTCNSLLPAELLRFPSLYRHFPTTQSLLLCGLSYSLLTSCSRVIRKDCYTLMFTLLYYY